MAKRILIADDSVTIQKAFAMVFGGQDFSIVSARSVDEAVAAVRGGRPDLIIADAVLGNGNGYDLCATLKGDPALRGVPVYILTSSHVPYDEARGRRVGANGTWLKPFDSQALLDQVNAALASGAAQVPAPPPSRPELARPELSRPEPARPAPAPMSPPLAARDNDRMGTALDDEDDYGEFTIERPSGAGPLPVARPAAPLSRPMSAPVQQPAAASLRPSLIPGVRPGMPRESTVRPVVPPPASVAPSSPGVHRQVANRTMMGMPSAVPQQTAQVSLHVRPPASPTPAPAAARPVPAPPPSSPGMAPAVSAAVAQKMSAIAARGPEYEAIAKLSREVIEQVVWEIVPELAEAIIRQEVDRLANAKR